MSVASGAISYSLGQAPVTACGLSWDSSELDSALNGPVRELVFDEVGIADIAKLIEGIPDTEFDQVSLRRIFQTSREPEDWRVGEAIAETYVSDHRGCHFPWPDGRDERKSGSSLPGADLVGFQKTDSSDRFAFGEVKTSGDASYPPNTMYGRTGLRAQVEDLRDKVQIRDDLVRYLAHRAALNPPWKLRFVESFKKYGSDNSNVQLFGCIVRDVAPHQDDLRKRTEALAKSCSGSMSIEMLAIYLPAKSIEGIGSKVHALHTGGSK